MKKLTVLLIFVLTSVIAFGQELDNEIYFRFGYSNPSWKQFGFTKDKWLAEGFEKKAGGLFELGAIFTINSLPATENMAIGVNVDYLYLNYSGFSSNNNKNDHNIYFDHLRIGSKIGPSFTYNPLDKLEFDIFAKANISWAAAAVFYEDEINNADDFYLGFISLGYSIGLNIRYDIFMLGFETENVSPKLESNEYPGEYFGNASDDDCDKSPLPSINFTLGLSF